MANIPVLYSGDGGSTPPQGTKSYIDPFTFHRYSPPDRRKIMEALLAGPIGVIFIGIAIIALFVAIMIFVFVILGVVIFLIEIICLLVYDFLKRLILG